ncbi:MAG: DUF2791 family P-loop domain-containing protein [Desulfobacteraceae bacterium]
MTGFNRIVEETKKFTLRRVVERLREGLFDPFGVQVLTAHEHQLNKVFDRGVHDLLQNKAVHLCVCGAYGQGKSHTLSYLRQRALEQGFVVSLINLDPREIPLYDFHRVYRALANQIIFPDGSTSLVKQWRKWANNGYKNHLKKDPADRLSVIPEEMPHLFKATLTALANRNMTLSRRQKASKKHAAFRPREFPWILTNALNGNAPPVLKVRYALKYRQVDFYKDKSLVCKGWKPYFELVRTLAAMFQQMGYKGWAVLFDEAESTVQTSINIRRKNYTVLDQFFRPQTPMDGLFPIFALTHDFFTVVQNEDYGRVMMRNEEEILYFPENYGQAWQKLNIHDLSGLSPKEWQALAEKLILFHAKAYDWQPQNNQLREQLTKTLNETAAHEPRLKIKALVDQLDFVHQEMMFN